MRAISVLCFLSILGFSIAISVPRPSSILQPPSPPISGTNSWPATPWTYVYGDKVDIFTEYGRSSNSTADDKRIIFATLKLEEKIIKGDDTYQNQVITVVSDVVTLRMTFSGTTAITKEEIFVMVDQWRVYCGTFGAREMAQGQIVIRKPWSVAAIFSIKFNLGPSSTSK